MVVTYSINQGWLILHDGSDGFKLYVEEIKMDWKSNPKINHYAGKTHLFYSLQKDWYVWTCKNVYLTSHTDYSAVIDQLKDWMDGSTSLTFLTQRTSGGSYTEWDGDNTSYTVAIPKDGVKGIQKISPGDGDVWLIQLMILEQVG